jgi:hypothetical protein
MLASRHITRSAVLGISAFLGAWYYALQVKFACGELTPMQCLLTPLSWAAPAVFGPLEKWARPTPKAEPSPSPPVALKKEPSAAPPAEPAAPAQPVTPPAAASEVKRTTPSAPSRQRVLTVVNSGKVAVEFVWVSACHVTSWGRDRLRADEIIRPGERRQFDNLSDGTDNCCFDFRVRYVDGRQNVARNMDLCRGNQWTVGVN